MKTSNNFVDIVYPYLMTHAGSGNQICIERVHKQKLYHTHMHYTELVRWFRETDYQYKAAIIPSISEQYQKLIIYFESGVVDFVQSEKLMIRSSDDCEDQ